MALDVNEVRKTVDALFRKNQIGNYLTTANFNRLAKKIQLSWYEKRIAKFQANRTIAKDIQDLTQKTYIFKSSVNRDGSVNFSQPSDYWELDSVTIQTGYTKDGVDETNSAQAEEVTDMEFDYRLGSEEFKPTTDYPIFKVLGDSIVVAPKVVDEIGLTYIKYPTAPSWVATIEPSGRESYNSGSSTQFSVPEDAFGEIVDMFLAEVGISTRDQLLTQYGINQQDAK